LSALTFRYPAHIEQEADESRTVCNVLFAVTGDLRQRSRTTQHGLCPYVPGYQLVSTCQQNDHSSVADIPPSSRHTQAPTHANLLTFPDLLQYLRNFHVNFAVQYSLNDTLSGFTGIFKCQ